MSNLEYQCGFITIIGRPNVGKSTLLNTFLREKIAIVSDKPQTTRNRILGVRNLKNSQLVFLDTPGIHKPRYRLNRRMVRVSLGTLQEVDLVLFIVDPAHSTRARGYRGVIGSGDRFILDRLKEINTPVFLVPNKLDLIQKEKVLPFIKEFTQEFNFSEVIPISAMTGDNVDRLMNIIVDHLPRRNRLFPEDVITDQPVRFIAAEFIREKILHHTREEIPYSVAVSIEDFKEETGKPTHIHACILIERSSQKGILIGNKGSMLKMVGTEARKDLESLLGNKVYLELWVKIQKDWRQNEPFLSEIGY